MYTLVHEEGCLWRQDWRLEWCICLLRTTKDAEDCQQPVPDEARKGPPLGPSGVARPSRHVFYLSKTRLFIFKGLPVSGGCRWSPFTLAPGCLCSQRTVWPSADQAREVPWGGSVRLWSWKLLAPVHLQWLCPPTPRSPCWACSSTKAEQPGLKHGALMMFPLSSPWGCLPSSRFHSMAQPTLPPEAQRDPSGETVSVQTASVAHVIGLQFIVYQVLYLISVIVSH